MNNNFKPRLSPIKTPQKQADFATVDIEGMNWTKFIVLGHYTGKAYFEFKSLKKYFEFLELKQTPTTIVAHFGGKYDFLFLLKELLKHEKYKILAIVPRGSSILYFDVVINNTTYTFRDSSALLPFSLKSITENFGTDTKKGEWDHTKTRGYSKKLGEYLRDDCISLHQSLRKLFDWPLIRKSGPAWTMASQAMRVFRTYIDEDIPALGKHQSDFCRKAYLGGRTEIFKPYCKEGPLFEYDVNSLYPYVMQTNDFPQGQGYWTYEFKPKELGIYQCSVIAPEIRIPALGIVREGKYIFPTGRFSGHFTSSEILYAKSLGYKFRIRDGISFEARKNIFRQFISDLYAIRQTSPKNSVSDILAKLLMNSSYGRYGMNLQKENIGFDYSKEGSIEFKMLKIGKKNIQLYREPVTLNSFSHVAIAAFVTSYARIHMHKLMAKNPDDIYYTDTDSIFTTRQMDAGPELGQLKLESIYDSAIFLLPKTYIAKNKTKTKRAMKGFSKRKIENFDMFDFKTALEGDLRKFKIDNEPKFATLKTALNQKKLVTMTKASTKQLKATYNKRIIYKDQNGELDTKPIHLGEQIEHTN